MTTQHISYRSLNNYKYIMSPFIKYTILVLVVCLALVAAAPSPQDYDDLNSAASDHEHLGRVQIKVYRGPTEHDGHDHFAPWGFWVKQPADDHH